MLQQKTIEIGNDKYLITQLPATKGLRLSKQIGKIASPMMETYFKDDSTFVDLVTTFLTSIDDVDFEGLAKELMSSVYKNNIVINFDTEFAGKYDVLFNLMIEVVKFNFSSVFTLLGLDPQDEQTTSL